MQSNKSNGLHIKLNGKSALIPDWIIWSDLRDEIDKISFVNYSDNEITRETEKAILVKWFTKFGNITIWVPKSQLQYQ